MEVDLIIFSSNHILLWFFIDRFLEVHLYKPSHSNIGWWSVNNLSFTEETLIMIEIGKEDLLGQRQNLKRHLFKELNQPIDYTPKYTFKC
jgi:hypothetical protein